MTLLKATAIAHPSQAMIPFHGFSDHRRRTLPVDLLFCTIDNLHTVTTIEFLPHNTSPSIVLNSLAMRGPTRARVVKFVNRLSHHYGLPRSFRMESRNSFPSNSGLGTSGSAFAALTKAIASVAGENDERVLSQQARLGSISAACSLVGGVSLLHSDPDMLWADSVVDPARVPLVVLAVPILSTRATADRHSEGRDSPLYDVVRKLSTRAAKNAIGALRSGNIWKLGNLVEQQMSYNLALLSTGPSRLLMWHPETLSVAYSLKEARSREHPVFFAMNSGPSLFCYAPQSSLERVRDMLNNLNRPIFVCRPTTGARIIPEHLF